jgi:SAM-dependent methyltransferase
MIDVNGAIMRDVFDKGEAIFIVERDDGYTSKNPGSWFNSPLNEWPECQREALHYVRGRVLDIGCGMGRVSRVLQSKGHEVTGIDISPIAIDLCKEGGVKDARVMSAAALDFKDGLFDTVILFGNNWGILGEPEKVVNMLKGLHRVTTKKAVILAETFDPSILTDDIHVQYHENNVNNRNPPGLWRIRLKYENLVGDWEKILFVDKKLMSQMANEAGWLLEEVIGERELYVGVLKKV